MKWTRTYPKTPDTYWWSRGRYKDGKIEGPVIICADVNVDGTLVYFFFGDTEVMTPAEFKERHEICEAVAEFAGPIVPPEEDEVEEQ